jgi:hypothetical protein
VVTASRSASGFSHEQTAQRTGMRGQLLQAAASWVVDERCESSQPVRASRPGLRGVGLHPYSEGRQDGMKLRTNDCHFPFNA